MQREIHNCELSELVIEFDELHMRAWVNLQAGEFASLDNIKKSVAKSGIRFGLDLDGLRDLMFPMDEERCVILARGKERLDGEDSKLELCVQEHLPYTIRPDGSFDYHGAVNIQTVHQGSPVARVSEAGSGCAGMTVKGVLVHAHEGITINPESMAGDGVTCNDTGTIVAVETGVFSRTRQGKMQVTPLVTIDGDVDLSVGNIDTDRPVLIKGDIKSGFIVKSTGDITVEGVIEDSRVSAGANLIVNKGILPGKQRVKAHGSVCAKFIQDREIKCATLVVEKDVRHAQIFVREDVVVDSLVGGVAHIGNVLQAANLGTNAEEKTEIHIGVDMFELQRCQQSELRLPDLLNSLDARQKALKEASRLLAEATHKAQDLAHKKAKHELINIAVKKAQSLTEDRQKALDAQQAVEQEIAVCRADAERIDQLKQAIPTSEVHITRDVHVGVTVQFGNARKKLISNTLTAVALHLVDGDVIVRL